MAFNDDTSDPSNDKFLQKVWKKDTSVDIPNSDVETLDTTVDEWRAEMERYDKKNIVGKTLMELSRELQISKTAMGNRLQALINEGRCIRSMGMRFDRDGRRFEVAVYQLIPKEEKK